MGYLAYVCSNRKDDVGVPYADHFFNISILDVESIIELIKNEDIKYLVTGASDLATLTLGKVNSLLGFSGIKEEQVINVTDKRKFLELQKELELFHPFTYFIDSENDLKNLTTNNLRFPMIMKPYFSSGSRGVRIVKTLEEIFNFHSEVTESSSQKKGYLLQEFLTDAVEYGCECFVEDGKLVFLELTHKFLNQNKVPIGHLVPNEIDEGIKNKLIKDVQKIIDRLKIKNSPINIDVLFDSYHKPFIIDLSFRLGGNCLPQLMDLKYNLKPFDLVINNCLMIKNPEIPEPNNGFYGSIIFGANSDGVLTEKLIAGIKNISDNAEKTIEFVLDVPIGGKFKKFTQGNYRFGHVILKTKNQEQYKHILNEIYSII